MSRFSPRLLLEQLREWPAAPCYWLALSGGLDSCVLLHALHRLSSELSAEVKAIHINHGWDPKAQEWAHFCQAICNELGIPCQVIAIDARPPPGESPEAWARQRRYQAMERLLSQGEMVLTAHQQDDQAETLLLQLLRGAGPRGLAAMPRCIEFGPGWLGRPLLDFTRDELNAYAIQEGLSWIEDPSNRNTRFDRNFLRQEIIPLLKRRWPNLSRTLARAAIWQADAARLLEDLARQDLEAVCSRQQGTLSVEALMQLETERRNNALRFWFRNKGLPMPSADQLNQLCQDALKAGWDATPCLRWRGAEVRRYRDNLYALPPLPPHDPKIVLPWDLVTPLPLPLGTLRAERVHGTGLKATLGDHKKITIRFRQGGEHCRLQGRLHTRSLKHLFQEAGIPPWQRDRIPLLYLDNKLAAVAGFWVCHPFGAEAEEEGWRILWDLD